MDEQDTTQEAPPPEATQEAAEQPAPEQHGQPRDDKGKWRPKDLPPDEEWQEVELSPDAQRRFNRVYRQLKQHQGIGEQLLKDNAMLMERLAKLEAGLGEREQTDQLTRLKQEKAQALAEQDYQRVVDIDDQILALRTTQRPEPKPVEPRQVATDFEDDLDPDTTQAIIAWRDERGPDGNLLRPWFNPRHPLHEKAKMVSAAVNVDPDIAPDDHRAAMAAIDRLMGVGPARPAKSPPKPTRPMATFAPDTPSRAKAPSPELTAEQIYIAKRMFPNDKDAVERYKKAMVKTHGKR